MYVWWTLRKNETRFLKIISSKFNEAKFFNSARHFLIMCFLITCDNYLDNLCNVCFDCCFNVIWYQNCFICKKALSLIRGVLLARLKFILVALTRDRICGYPNWHAISTISPLPSHLGAPVKKNFSLKHFHEVRKINLINNIVKFFVLKLKSNLHFLKIKLIQFYTEF